jgi:hypothetical protein
LEPGTAGLFPFAGKDSTTEHPRANPEKAPRAPPRSSNPFHVTTGIGILHNRPHPASAHEKFGAAVITRRRRRRAEPLFSAANDEPGSEGPRTATTLMVGA